MEEFNKSVTGGMVRRLVRVGVVFELKWPASWQAVFNFARTALHESQNCCAAVFAICEEYWSSSVVAEVPEESAADNGEAVDFWARVVTQ
mgnify:CR=1 FL=1